MLNQQTEKALTRVLYLGSFLTTVFLLTNVVTDPVNVTKHFLLGSMAFAGLSITLINGSSLIWSKSRAVFLIVVIFLILAIVSMINSGSPATQNLYGTYGRNTGFIAYMSLVFIFVSALTIRRKESFQKLIYALVAAGLLNITYCFWAWQVGDFVGWNNPYNTILGTFGNPNFIGAFLGIILSVVLALAVQPKLSWKWRAFCVVVIVIGFLEIRYSKAVQGVVVTGAGFAIVGFFLIRNKFKSWGITLVYSLLVFAFGIVALLGALQIGPLAQFVYKTSVSLRGEYWQAGINMAKQFPWNGVGMDSYGDWYRSLRDESALIMPGPSTVTNAAHNVNLDVAAYGGWPLLVAYLALLICVIVSIIRVILRNHKYDPIFVPLSVGWVCYQIQAAISINQIGLAIWGWLLGGSLIAYEISTREPGDLNSMQTSKNLSAKRNKNSNVISPDLLAGVGLVIGALIAVPPLSADMKWSSAVRSGSVEKVKEALEPGYLNPLSSFRYASAVQLLEQNSLFDLSHEYALKAVAFNPNHFDSWRMLHAVKNASDSERAIALENLKRLDPNNPDVLAVRK
jgi:O-antigen ligase